MAQAAQLAEHEALADEAGLLRKTVGAAGTRGWATWAFQLYGTTADCQSLSRDFGAPDIVTRAINDCLPARHR